jgi:hypothetical protein
MTVGIRVNRLELDELWSFVGKKQRGHSTTPNLPPSARMADVLDFLRQEVYVRRDMLVLLAGRPENREYSRQFGSHPGNPGKREKPGMRGSEVKREATIVGG